MYAYTFFSHSQEVCVCVWVLIDKIKIVEKDDDDKKKQCLFEIKKEGITRRTKEDNEINGCQTEQKCCEIWDLSLEDTL